MVYGVCMVYGIWCIEPVEPPWLAGGVRSNQSDPLATGMIYTKFSGIIIIGLTQKQIF